MKSEVKYCIKCPPGTFKDRVFLGGHYNYGSLILAMADAVVNCGMTPIIVREFGIKKGTERRWSLYLLKRCKYAVFECSSDAGQMVELDNALRFKTVTLCLWDCSMIDEPRATSMVQSNQLFKKNKKGYRTLREMQQHIFNFLRNG